MNKSALATSHYMNSGITDERSYWARCTCGWHSESMSAALSDWNVRGHQDDVEQSRRAEAVS